MRILVLNQYAVPVSEGGLTRHIDLFDRLDTSHTFEILTGDRSSQTRQRHTTTHPNFHYIRIPEYDESNGMRRILGWLVYCLKSIIYGLRTDRPDVIFASSPHLLTAVSGLFLAKARRAKFVL